ncbi:MAG: hypothetical protein OJF62_001088 [Pseudolabrys sp.]|jgi:hypothetical protein|nr:hypothetical protein [Pseudolabrys sp.]
MPRQDGVLGRNVYSYRARILFTWSLHRSHFAERRSGGLDDGTVKALIAVRRYEERAFSKFKARSANLTAPALR